MTEFSGCGSEGMGTKINYLPGFYSMRDLNEDSSSSSCPLFYGDKTLLSNGQYCNGFMPMALLDGYPEHDMDALKQKMLEHEAVFKNQVCELHRLYTIQRDMMENSKRKEINEHRASMEPASSSSLHGSQVPLEEARKWHMADFPLLNTTYGRTSISGIKTVGSPTTCMKTNTTQPGQFVFQNGPTSMHCEGPRPLKLRKKLFDLRLPADEYVYNQEEDNLTECKESNLLGGLNCNPRGGPENSMKSLIGSRGLEGSNGLADLNEPIRFDEATAPSSVDFLSHIENLETKGAHKLAKPNAGYLGVTSESVRFSDGFSINSSIESKVNMRGRLPHIHEAGSTGGNNPYSANQGPQPDKLILPSHPFQGMLDQLRHPPGTSDYCRNEDMWRDGPRTGLVSSDRNRSSSCFTTSWSHTVSSWAKPTSSSAQNVTTFATSPKPLFFQRNESKSNGFHHASASGSKEVQIHSPSAGFGHLNGSRSDSLPSDRSTNHGFGIFGKVFCHAGTKPAIDINLNEVLPNEIVIPQDRNGESKPDDHMSALPWLKPKPLRDPNVIPDSDNPEIGKKDEISEPRTVGKILGIPIFENFRKPENEPSPTEEKNATNERKNISIDINVAFEPHGQIAVEKPTSEIEKPKNGAVTRGHIIDLNSCVSDCEDPPALNCERNTARASVKITLEIDLEVPFFLESGEDSSTLSKENIQDEEVHLQPLQNEPIKDEEVLRSAAEAIFAISSPGPKIVLDPPEDSLAKALLWFADSISSYKNESSGARNCYSKEIDDFEAWTLQIAETKEEVCMPEPFVSTIEKEEENRGNALATRSRRGQSRRGRQRRNFQRDILPGLTSLSRHEVTEDLQIFGGLMMATGYSWNSGLARRNGGRRGRRRTVVVENNVIARSNCAPLVKQVNNSNDRIVEVGGLDRSLIGWGKTTRRPRRQRCPAGHISTIVIT
ncbi:hypothetical protein OROGR_002063 [Orobanche gracilis]